jgi:hypothetical protein
MNSNKEEVEISQQTRSHLDSIETVSPQYLKRLFERIQTPQKVVGQRSVQQKNKMFHFGK